MKVITFSIGFGPKVLRIRGKETEYCVALFPLGGFVKMLEESREAEPILPEDRERTFESQALWKRIVIVLAGPAMNVLFPIVLYTVRVPRGPRVSSADGRRRAAGQAGRREAHARATGSCRWTARRSHASPKCSDRRAQRAGVPLRDRRAARRPRR